MKLTIPPAWRHDFEISSCGKFITLKLSIPNLPELVGHKAKRVTLEAMFDCFQFGDRKIQQILINLLEELNKYYHAKIDIR